MTEDPSSLWLKGRKGSTRLIPYGATKRPRLVWLLAGRPLMARVASPTCASRIPNSLAGSGGSAAAIVEEAGRHAGYAPDFVFNSASCSVRNARISSVMASNVIHCSLQSVSGSAPRPPDRRRPRDRTDPQAGRASRRPVPGEAEDLILAPAGVVGRHGVHAAARRAARSQRDVYHAWRAERTVARRARRQYDARA